MTTPKQTVLRIGIAPRSAIETYTRDIVSGKRKKAVGDPDIWFSSIESFAKVLSDRNRALLALISVEGFDSIDALAAASGRAKSNLSRTLKTMENLGLVRLEKGEGRKLKPVVTFQRLELNLPLAA